MSRLDVRCKMGHTALFPAKNDVRTEWLRNVPARKDIITISHGMLDIANTVLGFLPERQKGRILICDTDPGVIEASRYMREGDPRNGKPSDYPRLKFLEEKQGDVRDCLREYLSEHDAKRLGVIDLDLTGTLEQVWPILLECLQTLKCWSHSRGIKVLLTYRNGRDMNGCNAARFRLQWLKDRLPRYTRCTWHRCYRSDWTGRYATRERGSSMAIAAVEVR